jgi:hypothetical protein
MYKSMKNFPRKSWEAAILSKSLCPLLQALNISTEESYDAISMQTSPVNDLETDMK